MKLRFIFIWAAIFLAAALLARSHAHGQAIAQAKLIVAADMKGESVVEAIKRLKAFTHTHAGGGVTFSLVGSYNRDKAAAEAAARAANGSGAVYAQAQAACAGRADSIQQANCVQSYLASHLTSQPTAAPVVAPDTKNYIYVLKSPIAALDWATLWMAGALLLGAFGLKGLAQRRFS